MARLLTEENIKYATNFFRERIKGNVLLLGERPAIHIALAALNSAKQRPRGMWKPFFEEVEIYNTGGFTARKQTGWICGKCKSRASITHYYKTNYCPNCGAKMDEEEDN